MNTKLRTWIGTVILSSILVTVGTPAYGQSVNRLQPFESFIGTWKFGNSLQVFEWGPGKASVIAKSYRVESDSTRTLVSSGIWTWHPGEQEIKGYISATKMPVSFFEYTTEFIDEKMVSQLSAYDKSGNRNEYREEVKINTDSTYKWTLYQEGKPIMGGLFRHVKE